MEYDLIVIGGGPAGATLASLVKIHAPSRRVLLLEKSPGPRHHVGESLLPGMIPVLKELGVYEKVDSAGFPRKLGANYVWGESREPWENDFDDANISDLLRRYGRLPDNISHTWQVRRKEYDEILLRRAEELGVEVVRGACARGIAEADGRVAGLEWTAPDGSARRSLAPFTADCSGQSGFLSRFRRVREKDARLRNVAGYAYFRGARWKYEFTGHPDKTKIFICSVPSGWFWYIPVSRDVVSVGLVAPAGRAAGREGALRELFFDELSRCEELRPLLKDASLETDFGGAGRDFFLENDSSFVSAAASGPGWLACGDAAMFVDPILSTGVTLAHLGAHRAAYTLLTEWEGGAAARTGLLWSGYDAYMRESAALFHLLALFWYGNDRTARGWWKKAREIQRAALPIDLDDHTAFITVSTGLTRHYERLMPAADLLDEQAPPPEESPFYAAVLNGGPGRAGAPATDERPRLLFPYRVELAFHPKAGEGRLIPLKRARFLKHPVDDPLSDALNPRRFVSRWHLSLLAALDGGRTWGEALAAAAADGAPSWWLERRAPAFLEELRVQGAASWPGAEVCA